MINSVYDKKLENLRKAINVRLVNNAKDYKIYVSKDLVAINEIKPILTLDKQIYEGFSILDLSQCFRNDSQYES